MLIALLATILIFPRQETPAPDPGVVSRGDHAMGFSHETTTHHFRLSKSGGVIEVVANNPEDAKSRDEIRMHLTHIARKFSAGDFDVPMFIHSTTPPGVPVMRKLRNEISYRFEDTPQGAHIIITAKSPDAINAIHDFLRFQISDHRTGDPTTVQ